MTDIEKALADLRAADDAKLALDRAMSAEIAAATNAIREAYSDRLAEARAAVRAATIAHTAALDATPDHPWTGKRVFKMQPGGGRIWERKPPVRVEGIADTWRSNSPAPANTSKWNIPKIGEPIVRFLKKDGSAGAKFERLQNYSGGTAWKLVEDEPS